jgi:putative colanic acid biosynthesis UDP-glucose lipid carrier transferase
MFPRGLMREYSRPLSVVARVMDVLCVLIGGLLAYSWRFGQWEMPVRYQVSVLLALVFTAIFFSLSGIYRSWRGQGWLQQARILTFAWLSVVIVLLILAFMTKTSTSYSRQWMGAWAICAWSFLILFRFSLTHFLRIMRSSGFNQRRIVVVGAGDLGRRIAGNLKNAEWTGLNLVGFFDDNPDLHGTTIEGIKVRGSVNKLSVMAERSHIDEIWLALPLRAEQRVKEILYELRHCTATVRFVPDIFGLRLLNHSIAEVAGLPVLNISESPMYGLNRVIKFLEDKIIAGSILTLISPLMVAIAIGVKLSSPGPIFYRQKRVSWNGRPFMMLKFRSMPVDVERGTGAVWAKSGEDRATKFGAFLRRTSLDELPQFIDVLKGNMSIVGPRPERPVFVEKFKDEIPDYMKKHMVKAGITGWAQVNGWRGDTDLKKRIEYDLYYIENWSLWFDLKIIFRTLFSGFVHKNAY